MGTSGPERAEFQITASERDMSQSTRAQGHEWTGVGQIWTSAFGAQTSLLKAQNAGPLVPRGTSGPERAKSGRLLLERRRHSPLVPKGTSGPVRAKFQITASEARKICRMHKGSQHVILKTGWGLLPNLTAALNNWVVSFYSM